MEYKLRPYQRESIEAVWKYMREKNDNPCVVLPTGTGKSVVLGKIAADAVNNWNGRVLVLAHVKELLEQNSDKIKSLCDGVDVGIYSAGLKSRDTKEKIIVAGIQSVYRRACELGAFDLIIVDEAHLIAPEGETMYRTFLNDMKVINPSVRVIGFTATPFRLNGGMICKPENILNEICYEAGIKEMINAGYLSPVVPKGGTTEGVDFDKLHIRAGEFVSDEVDVLMNNEKLVRNACNEIVNLTKDRYATLVFGCNIEHAEKIKKYIEHFSGEECGIVTGETSSAERNEILERIRGNEIKTDLFGGVKKRLRYLVNVSVLTTGFDAPCIDCVAILRPTASPGLLLQMVGRGFRLSPSTGKKNCLLLDYGENIMRHGPIDAIRIDEKRHGNRKGEKPAKMCPQCQSLIDVSRATCPECGYAFPPKELHHDEYASSDGVISGQITDKEYDVKKVTYSCWMKRGGDETTPKTLMIEYELGLNNYFREWICPEHTGYARGKFEKWWREHAKDENAELPSNSIDAENMASAGALKYPSKVTVRHITGEKFDRIISYEYGEDPNALPEFVAEDSFSDGCNTIDNSDLSCFPAYTDDDSPF